MTKVEPYLYSLIVFSLPLAVSAIKENRNVLDTIVATVNHAKNYFDVAKDVANLVSKSWNQNNEQRRAYSRNKPAENDHSFLKHTLVGSFFRMLKLDSPKIMAIAINSVIFLAQLISTLFDMKTNSSKSSDTETKKGLNYDPMKFILEHKNDRVKRLIQQAQDPKLPSHLIRHASGFDSTCVRLLICKTDPVIWAAQKSLKDKTLFKNRKMTSWLPERDEFEDNSDHCDEKHTDCMLFSNT